MLLVNRGLIRFQRGRLDQAAADYQEAIRLKKDPFLAHAELAHVYQKQGKTAEAIEQFSRAIARETGLSPALSRAGRARCKLASTRPPRSAAARSDLKMAILHEDPTIRSWPRTIPISASSSIATSDSRTPSAKASSPWRSSRTIVDAHVLKVQALLKLRRFDEVVRSCDVALAKGRKSPLLYELRGLAQAAHDDYPGAIRDYGRALEIRPDDGRLLVLRGWAYLFFDSPKPALVDFEAAIKLDPQSSEAFNGRGTALRGSATIVRQSLMPLRQ